MGADFFFGQREIVSKREWEKIVRKNVRGITPIAGLPVGRSLISGSEVSHKLFPSDFFEHLLADLLLVIETWHVLHAVCSR